MASKGDLRAGRAYVELYLRNGALTKGLRQSGRMLSNFGNSVQSIGRTLATGAGFAAIPFAVATKAFADFDDQMREVAAVSGAVGQEFQQLTNTARMLGRTTSFTAGEVASIMAELGRAGFASQQIDVMTESVLNLARATKTEAALAAGIMAASIRQFGLGAGDATRVADALTAAANKSFNTVESLGESLSYAGPVASDFNMSIEETLAILGALGNVGIQGSNAGTALRRLLTLTGAEAAKMKEVFGVEFIDAAGNARPLVDTLHEVNEATKGLGTAARAQKFNEAFGLLGITGASAISKNAVNVKELYEEIEKADGIAQKTAEAMDAGIGGSFRRLLSAVEGVALSLGEALAPSIANITEGVGAFLGNVTAWIDSNRGLVVSIMSGIAAVGALGAALFVAGGAIAAAGAALTGIASVIGAVGSVAAFVMTPVGALIAALAGAGVAVAASFAVVFAKSQEFRTTLAGSFNELLALVKGIGAGISDAFQGGDMQLAWQIAMQGLEVLWMETLDNMLDVAVQWAQDLRQVILDNVGNIAEFVASPTAFAAKQLLKGGDKEDDGQGFWARREQQRQAARQRLSDLQAQALAKRRGKEDAPGDLAALQAERATLEKQRAALLARRAEIQAGGAGVLATDQKLPTIDLGSDSELMHGAIEKSEDRALSAIDGELNRLDERLAKNADAAAEAAFQKHAKAAVKSIKLPGEEAEAAGPTATDEQLAEGKQIEKSVRTAQEKFDAEVEKLFELRDAKAISQETFDRRVAEVSRDLHQADPLREMKEEAQRIAEASRTPDEVFQDQAAKLKQLHETRDAQGNRLLDDQSYQRALLKADQDRISAAASEAPGAKGGVVGTFSAAGAAALGQGGGLGQRMLRAAERSAGFMQKVAELQERNNQLIQQGGLAFN